jgi:potassium-transporting ATPase KdpC subunit
MKTYFFPSLRITLLTMFLFGVLYPLVITGIAKLIGANGGEGETIMVDNRLVGFEVIGQSFESDQYFNSRPSAVGYNAAATGGSNKGPTNPEYLTQVQARIDTFLVHNPEVTKDQIPVDLITASGSGLDPDISVQGALVQIPRIAKERNIDSASIKALVLKHSEKPLWNLFGPEKVNVLKLNLDLDKLMASK